MSKIEARVLTDNDYPEWDKLVEQSKQGTIFHSSIWVTTAAEILHLNYTIIGVFRDGQLIGGCTFYLDKKFRIFITGYTDVPLFPYGGIVILDSKSSNTKTSETREHEIIGLILEKIQTLGLSHVNLINSPALCDIRPFKYEGWREYVYYAYIKSLEHDIFLSFSPKVRTHIREARKMGISVRREYNPEVYWKLTESTYGRQNLKIPIQKKQLFAFMEMLVKNKLGEMWIAWTSDGEPASAEFLVWDAKRVYMWIAASDERFKKTSSTSLSQLEIFQNLQERGFREVNMMSGNMSNLSMFASSFNPCLVPYYRVEQSTFIFPILQRVGRFFTITDLIFFRLKGRVRH
jgi:hypothetical protein